MRQDKIKKGFVCILFILVLAGCLSVPDSPEPRFYMPQAVDKNQTVQTFAISPNTYIGLGPIRIPEYLNRPQMVTVDKEGMLKVAQFDRWGEPLDFALSRAISQDLAMMLPGSIVEIFPWNLSAPIKYKVSADIIQIEGQLDKNLFFLAQWSVTDLERKQMLLTKTYEFSFAIIPQDYLGLSKAVSQACASLSSQIAQELSLLAAQEGAGKGLLKSQ
jgi:uncharacterized lipoprotein YmbA